MRMQIIGKDNSQNNLTIDITAEGEVLLVPYNPICRLDAAEASTLAHAILTAQDRNERLHRAVREVEMMR